MGIGRRTMKGRRSQVAKKYTASGRMRRGRPGQGGPLRDLAIAYSSIMAGFCEPRTTSHGFSSDSDAATRRQTQTNNDASGNPQRVAGRPLGVPYGIAYRRWSHDPLILCYTMVYTVYYA